MMGIVDIDVYVKKYFFKILVLVIRCFDLNLFYMELTADNMDGTEVDSKTDLNIFCP